VNIEKVLRELEKRKRPPLEVFNPSNYAYAFSHNYAEIDKLLSNSNPDLNY